MNYLVTTDSYPPYFTEVMETSFDDNKMVYDLTEKKFTIDGINWNEIIILL